MLLKEIKRCQIDGCPNPHFAKQLCISHYFKNYRKTDEFRKKASKYQIKYYHKITKNNPESMKRRKEKILSWKRNNKDGIMKFQRKWRKINPKKVREEGHRHYNKMLQKMGKSLFSIRELAYSLNYWAKMIKKRDAYKCQICGTTQDLAAHHIFQKMFHPKLCLNFNNGITLCRKCHSQTHGQLLILS